MIITISFIIQKIEEEEAMGLENKKIVHAEAEAEAKTMIYCSPESAAAVAESAAVINYVIKSSFVAKAMEMNLTQVSDLDPMLANIEVSPHRKTLLGSVPESFSLSVLRRFSVRQSYINRSEGLLERASIQLG
ncbi:hypothetical protein Tco_0271604 [Tanacetum coccineum]